MTNFKKISANAIIFAFVYTFCMYHNSASIMFPVLMAAGIWFLYSISNNRRPFDNRLSAFYNIVIGLISISVFMTDDYKLILMSKCIVLFLYFCLAIELFADDSEWQDHHYIKAVIGLCMSSIGNGFLYLSDKKQYKTEQEGSAAEEKPKHAGVGKVIKGLIITIPLLFIIVPLMMSADIVFMGMVENIFDLDRIFEFVFEDVDVLGIAFTIVCALVLFYGLQRTMLNFDKMVFANKEKTDDVISAITVTGVIGFVYAVFSFVQIRGILFSGVKLPEGYTYAQYAREGFFQLFILALINMAIVLFCASKYEYNLILRSILYALCVFTYVMIFSSTYKMLLYIKVYNLTFLRIMVLWALAVIAVIMTAVVRYVYKNDFSLFKFAVVVVASFYIIIAFLRPDYIVAKYNLEMGNTEYVGWSYIDRLSCDAVPVVVNYNKEYYDNKGGRLYEYARIHNEEMSFRTFNLSVYIAGEKLNLH